MTNISIHIFDHHLFICYVSYGDFWTIAFAMMEMK